MKRNGAEAVPRGFEVERRALLSMFAGIVIAAAAGPTTAHTRAAHESFLELSRLLTGRTNLDAEQSMLFFEAFVQGTAEFATRVERLLSWIEEHNLEAVRLQKALDAEGSPLADLPRQIMTAWYTGIVGQGEAARCITFETSLMHQLVSDHLKTPSYCFGPHGSWDSPPI